MNNAYKIHGYITLTSSGHRGLLTKQNGNLLATHVYPRWASWGLYGLAKGVTCWGNTVTTRWREDILFEETPGRCRWWCVVCWIYQRSRCRCGPGRRHASLEGSRTEDLQHTLNYREHCNLRRMINLNRLWFRYRDVLLWKQPWHLGITKH